MEYFEHQIPLFIIFSVILFAAPSNGGIFCGPERNYVCWMGPFQPHAYKLKFEPAEKMDANSDPKFDNMILEQIFPGRRGRKSMAKFVFIYFLIKVYK